ncbi:MAG: uroporphyrinogen-III synthase [Gammaproteobacteria bacterium]|nr:uroporphyrinogen-III synthase [Gammaproteobacteria bacterium]
MLVWITRSQPGAERQAAVIREHGHQALVAPATTISQLPDALPRGSYTDIIFLSEHAVRFGVNHLLDAGVDLASVAVFAIGPSTAARLSELGIFCATPAVPSSEGLLAMPEFADTSGRCVLIVAGDGGRDVLAAGLEANGARTRKFSVYRRAAVDRLEVELTGVEAIAVGSGDGFKFMARLWFAAGGRRDVPVFVPSRRVAGVGEELGFSSVHPCAGADGDALLAGLAAFTSCG